MQARTPQHLRGRVVGIITSSTYAAGPLGFLLAGPLAQALGPRGAFLVLAVLLVMVALLAIPAPSLRELNDLSAPSA
jgi:MFS family permease